MSINSLLNELPEHNFEICISSMKLSAPSFADGISLLVLYPTFLQHFMNIAHKYSLKWRYEFNNIKSGIVTYGESEPSHFANMQERSYGPWVLKMWMNCTNIKTQGSIRLIFC